MPLSLEFLGTGTSAGVPMIGCEQADCACRSTDPRDRRDRCSVVIRYNDASGKQRQYLIDTSPDLRWQAIRAGLSRIDAVLYTHHHMDHILGIDDLRRFNAVMDSAIEVHAEHRVHEAIGKMFPHIFESHKNINKSFVPRLIQVPFTAGEPFDMHGSAWTPVRLMHGRLPIVGFRVDHGPPEDRSSIAYCTDVSALPPESYKQLAGLDVLVIDGLRDRHHPTHMTIEQACQIIDELEPKQAYLTHMAHDMIHAELDARLPEHISPAYDGLTVTLPL